MKDPNTTDIFINGTESFYIKNQTSTEPHPSPFNNRDELTDLIERLLLPLGKRWNARHPYIDGRLVEGSRFHIIFPPLAPQGPYVSIRKFLSDQMSPLESFLPKKQVQWLTKQMPLGKNILIAGATGAGKTTLLGRLLDRVNPEERILLLEECQEIQTRHPHCIRLESRSESPEGGGEISLSILLKNALRMRPARIILGECRGEEAYDLLQALNTGHAGSLSTIHANSARQALTRLESLALLKSPQIPILAIRQWIAACLDIVVFLSSHQNLYVIKEIWQLRGLEGETYRMAPIDGASPYPL